MKKQKKHLKLSTRHSLVGWIFMLPWTIGFMIFFAYPLFQSVVFSLNKVVITAQGRKLNYVGKGNFVDIFTKDAAFVERLGNFLLELVLELPLIIVFSLVIAILLN